MKSRLTLIVAVILWWLPLGWAQAANLKYVRAGEHGSFTRVVFEFQGMVQSTATKAGQSHDIKDSQSNKTIVKNIKYKIENDREKVFIALNNFSTPEILTLEGDKPRIVIDIKNVSSWSKHYRTPINGNLIKQIRTYLHRDTGKLRIVLDLNPSENYFINQTYYKTENIYCIEVR